MLGLQVLCADVRDQRLLGQAVRFHLRAHRHQPRLGVGQLLLGIEQLHRQFRVLQPQERRVGGDLDTRKRQDLFDPGRTCPR